MSDQVAEYRGLVESLAEQMSRTRAARNALAEYDDLVQEGLIFVWETLEKNAQPSPEHVRNRMKNWIRTMSRQRRGETETVSLDALDEQIEALATSEGTPSRRLQQDIEALVRPQL